MLFLEKAQIIAHAYCIPASLSLAGILDTVAGGHKNHQTTGGSALCLSEVSSLIYLLLEAVFK